MFQVDDREYLGFTVVSFAHTHGAYNKLYDDDNFSYADLGIADHYVTFYLISPGGYFKKYEPHTETVTIDIPMPYDEHHPKPSPTSKFVWTAE